VPQVGDNWSTLLQLHGQVRFSSSLLEILYTRIRLLHKGKEMQATIYGGGSDDRCLLTYEYEAVVWYNSLLPALSWIILLSLQG
jgi:hypothetical protein